MATVYGSNYQKEWVNDPSEQADKGTQNVVVKGFYDEFTGVAAADVLKIAKLQHKARFVGLSALSGALGAGAIQAQNKDGGVTVIAPGDLVDGQVEGGLDIQLVADGATSASLKALAQFLMD